MIAAILTIVVAMLVYIFWFIRMETSRLSQRIDESALGIARMNKELMGSVMEVLTQPMLPDLDEEDEDDEDDEDDGEDGEDGEGMKEEEDQQEEQVTKNEPLSTLKEVEDISTESDEVIIEVPQPTPKRGRKKATEKNSIN